MRGGITALSIHIALADSDRISAAESSSLIILMRHVNVLNFLLSAADDDGPSTGHSQKYE